MSTKDVATSSKASAVSGGIGMGVDSNSSLGVAAGSGANVAVGCGGSVAVGSGASGGGSSDVHAATFSGLVEMSADYAPAYEFDNGIGNYNGALLARAGGMNIAEGDYLQTTEKSWGAYAQTIKAASAGHRAASCSRVTDG